VAITNAWTDVDAFEVAASGLTRASTINGMLGNQLWLYERPMVAVRLTAAQPVAAATTSNVEWDEKVWGLASMWDVSSPATVVLPRTGTYLIDVRARFDETVEGDLSQRALLMYPNGSSTDRLSERRVATNPTDMGFTTFTSFLADDFFEVAARQLYTAAVDLMPIRTVLKVWYLGPWQADEEPA